MESKSIEEGLNVILLSQMHFSDVYYMYKVKFNMSFIFLKSFSWKAGRLQILISVAHLGFMCLFAQLI